MPLPLLKELSGHTNTAILERVYVQSSQRKARELIYAKHGLNLNDSKKEEMKPKECPTCYQLNKHKARFCSRCGSPMDLASALTHKANAEAQVGFLRLFNQLPAKKREEISVLMVQVLETHLKAKDT